MSERTDEPILIGGAGRSGTSLLRVMLDSHPRIACGPELKILPEIARFWQLFSGPLAPVLREYGCSPDDAAAKLRQFVYGLVDGYRKRSGKTRWAEKTPHNVLNLISLAKIFPHASFVHVIRDGRDVAASLVTMNWADTTGRPVDYVRSIPAAARYWRTVVETARQQSQHDSLVGRVYEVRYEDLVLTTETTMRRLLDFVGEPWDDNVLNYAEMAHGPELGESSTQQVSRPIYSTSIGRWKTDFSAQDRLEFEHEAGTLLRQLGYDQFD